MRVLIRDSTPHCTTAHRRGSVALSVAKKAHAPPDALRAPNAPRACAARRAPCRTAWAAAWLSRYSARRALARALRPPRSPRLRARSKRARHANAPLCCAQAHHSVLRLRRPFVSRPRRQRRGLMPTPFPVARRPERPWSSTTSRCKLVRGHPAHSTACRVSLGGVACRAGQAQRAVPCRLPRVALAKTCRGTSADAVLSSAVPAPR